MGKVSHVLGQLASGETVVDRFRSHLHGNVKEFIVETLAKVESQDRKIIAEQVELSRVVGKKICIENLPDDKIVYAQRLKRRGLTRFVLGREPEDSTSVTVILKKDDHSDDYVCMSAYIGTYSEPEPWDPYANPKSAAFWETHALVWDGKGIVEEPES